VKKITFIFALIILLAVFSAQAQQKPGIKYPPQPVQTAPSIQPAPTPEYDNSITVEDDATGTFLVFSPLSGKYKFFRCSEGSAIAVMSGTGKVKIDGCAVSLEDVQASHSVLASVNKCTQEGKAAIEQFPVKDSPYDVLEIKAYLSDANMRDNTQSCQPKK
jgi:hypothetical protein